MRKIKKKSWSQWSKQQLNPAQMQTLKGGNGQGDGGTDSDDQNDDIVIVEIISG
ncbi:MAG: hypothetical protein AAFR05_14435 [Bacteroidota bacterium]